MSDKSDDLIISISTDLATVRRGLARLEQETSKSSKAVQRQFDQMGKNIDTSFTRSFKRVEAGMAGLNRAGAEANAKFVRLFAAAGSTRGAQTMIDSATRIQNSLKIAGVEGENLTTVYDSLYRAAQKNGAPLEALSTLYGRAAMASKELGASQKELLTFTEGVSLALRVGHGARQRVPSASRSKPWRSRGVMMSNRSMRRYRQTCRFAALSFRP